MVTQNGSIKHILNKIIDEVERIEQSI